MATSLYDLSVASYLQTLGGVAGFMERALTHFTANNVDPNDVVETRLFPDMLPFRFQVQSVAHHTLGTIEGLKNGAFAPPGGSPAHDYAGLQKLVADTRDALAKLTPADVNAYEDRDIIFQMRDFKLPFTAANFVMSFSLPNVHFHATTAYDILRMKGVPLGKRDYMGQLRMKR
jgi:hypothetical protein